MWLKKNKKRDMQIQIDNLNSELNKIKRIVKYSDKSKITFNLDLDTICYGRHYDNIFNLFLYIDQEEYSITLDELKNHYLNDCTLEVKNKLAYFTCKAERENGTKVNYDFIIDYYKGKYVVTNVPIIEDERCDKNESVTAK